MTENTAASRLMAKKPNFDLIRLKKVLQLTLETHTSGTIWFYLSMAFLIKLQLVKNPGKSLVSWVTWEFCIHLLTCAFFAGYDTTFLMKCHFLCLEGERRFVCFRLL